MLICVGATSGYCAIGSDTIAPMPLNMMMIARTHAKIGRSMKIRDMLLAATLLLRCRYRCLSSLGCVGGHRLDRCSVLQVGGALGDHLLARCESLGDHP